MARYLTAAALTASFAARFAQTGTFDLQAGADKIPNPDFGGDETVESLQAAGVIGFNNAGKLVTSKPLTHFLVGGETVTPADLVDLPEADFKRMSANGQVREATPDEIAAATKAAKK